MDRSFTSGSRQAPDPFDQFLEEKGFYRKHTARDSSCLFRTISEQIYDTQIYHVHVRQRVVKYMRKHKSYFRPAIDVNTDFDNYLDDMSKKKTFGTLLELQAASFVFEKNILLFEAFNTGTWFQSHRTYDGLIRVFYTPERHFDSVFTSSFIRNAAFAQALVYEILYKNVFKLPDITFAVEQMLYSITSDVSNCVEHFSDQFCTKLTLKDGREFYFDTPENTCCILDDSKLCHFHNKQFTQFAQDLDWELNHLKGLMDGDERRITRTMDSLLPHKFISCVRQLLSEGITPFPYKVAKALDPFMYRNIEFDSWNEMRKANRLCTWYQSGSHLDVGVKCHVKLSNSQINFYTCHIQDISPEKGPCVVFVEELGEKRIVPYEFLKPFPPNLCKPWAMPIRLQRQIDRQTLRMRYRGTSYRERHDYYCYDSLKSDYFDEFCKHDPDPKRQLYNSIREYTNIQHFRTQPLEYCTMPLTVESDRNSGNDKSARNPDLTGRVQSRSSEVPKTENMESFEDQTEPHQINYEQYQHYQYNNYSDPYFNYQYDGNMVHGGGPQCPAPYYYVYNAPPCPQFSNEFVVGQNLSSATTSAGPNNYYLTNGNNIVHPSRRSQGQGQGQGQEQEQLTPLSTRINAEVKKSLKLNGSDLPADIATLRHFYNLGVDYHVLLSRSGSDPKLKKLTNEISSMSIEDCEQKSDLNNNEESGRKYDSSKACNNNYNNSHQHQPNQRKFQTRNFNRRDRAQNGNRFHQNDRRIGYNESCKKANTSGNNSNTNRNSNSNENSSVNSQNSCSQITKHISTSTNTPCSGSDFVSANIVSEPFIQSTSSVSVGTTVSESSDYSQHGQFYNQSHPPFTYGQYVPMFPNECGDHGPVSSGVFMPVPPPSYGMYPVPPMMTTGQAVHAAGSYQTFNQTFVGPPPPQTLSLASQYSSQAQGTSIHPAYYSPTPDQVPLAFVGPEVIDPNNYPYINYPQVYYSASNNGANTQIVPGNGGGAPPTQGFWCIPPPAIVPPQALPTIPIIPSSSSNNTGQGQVYPSLNNNTSINLNNVSH